MGRPLLFLVITVLASLFARQLEAFVHTSSNQRIVDGPRLSARDYTRLFQSEKEEPDYETEETLLCVRLNLVPGVDVKEAKVKVGEYCQGFPFSAVLPVQPLSYIPTDDNGVDVKFLRKKTDIKSGIDGGIRIFVEATEDGEGIEVTAKRNSMGQSINKIMAEKLVSTAFVSGLTGKERERYGEPPTDYVQVSSIYHKWM